MCLPDLLFTSQYIPCFLFKSANWQIQLEIIIFILNGDKLLSLFQLTKEHLKMLHCFMWLNIKMLQYRFDNKHWFPCEALIIVGGGDLLWKLANFKDWTLCFVFPHVTCFWWCTRNLSLVIFSKLRVSSLPLLKIEQLYIQSFSKKCSPKLCRVSTAQFMNVVHVEEPKESAFSRCPWQKMMHTEDGVTSSSERLRKPGKWRRILEDRSMMTSSTRARNISTPRILKYESIALWILSR